MFFCIGMVLIFTHFASIYYTLYAESFQDSWFDLGSFCLRLRYSEEVLGPRCVELHSKKSYTDDSGRVWNYRIEMLGACSKPTEEDALEQFEAVVSTVEIE